MMLISYTLLLSLFEFSIQILAGLDCDISSFELQGLQSIFTACGGKYWSWNQYYENSTVWHFPASVSEPCSMGWQGVTCAPLLDTNCSVIGLQLSHFNLSGHFPTEIGYFSQLQSLNVSRNNITGPIPSEIGSMSQLSVLALNMNNFSSFIPTTVGKLILLEYLDLGNNSLRGELPSELGQLIELSVLGLGDNWFDGSVPSALSKLSALEHVLLNNNRLDFLDFETFFRGVPRLIELNVEANYFAGTLPPIQLLPEIEIVAVDRNIFYGSIPTTVCSVSTLVLFSLEFSKFTGSLPTCLFNLTALESLNLFANSFEGTLPSEIGYLSNLINLYIGHNHFSGRLPTEIGRLTRVVDFSVYNNKFYGSIPTEITNMVSVERIQLDSNNFTGTLPSGMFALSNLESLELNINSLTGTIPEELSLIESLTFIYMNNNRFIGTVPSIFGSMTSLLHLDVAINFLNGTVPTILGNLNRLEGLYMSSNHFSGIIPTELCLLSSLEILHLDGNELVGSIPPCLGNVTTLKNLQLCCNNFTGTVPAEFQQLMNMQYFEISFTSIGGTIPHFISSWSVLVEIYLQYTNIEGPIPDEISNLGNLGVLDLSTTFITGTVPKNLGLLEKLQLLNLSFAHLSGAIPSSIANFRRLKIFSIGNNLFTGEIPENLGVHKALQYFSVNSNRLVGPVPLELIESQSLEILDTGNNFLNGSVPLRFGIGTNMTYMVLSSNMFTGTLPSNWSAFKNLQYVYADDNQLTGAIPEISIVGVSKLASRSLVQLNASKNFLVGTIPDALWSHTYLTVLSLSNNMLYGTVSSQIGNLKYLSNLDLSNNGFSGNLAAALTNASFTGLQFVNLQNNDFSGSLPVTIFQSPVLQVAIMNTNCFSGTLPSELCSSPELTALILDSLSSAPNCAVQFENSVFKLIKGVFPATKVTGTIPQCLFELSKLQSLQLAGNGLTGQIPSVEPPLTLTDMHLSYNALTGTIPEALQQRGNFVYLSLQNNKLTGTLMDSFVIGGPNVTVSEMTLHLAVNRLSGNVPTAFYDVGTISVVNGNLFTCLGTESLPQNDVNRDTYVCGSKQLNTALYVWLAMGIALLLSVAAVIVCLRCSARETATNSVRLTVELRPTQTFNPALTTPFDVTERTISNDSMKENYRMNFTSDDHEHDNAVSLSNRLKRVVRKVYLNSMIWLSFNYSSRRNLLFNAHQFTEVLTSAAHGAIWLSGSYLICMMVYIVLKSGSMADEYSTITIQDGWVMTSAYLHGYLPCVLLLVFVLVSAFAIILTLKIDTLLSAANRISMQREAWKRTLRFSRSAAISARFVDLICWPTFVHVINAVVCLTVNAVYVSLLLTVSPGQVFFLQCAMSLFKIAWVNTFIPFAINRMQYLPATSQFRHQVAMLLINYIVGPGIASAGANSNCFYPAIEGSPYIPSTYNEFTSFLSCVAAFQYVYTDKGDVDISDSVLLCKFSTATLTEHTDTVPPFNYSYQCGSSFVVDYVPVLLYSYLFSAIQLPVWRFLLLHVEQSTVRRWFGDWFYATFLAETVMDCDAFQGNKLSRDGASNPQTVRSPMQDSIDSDGKGVGSSTIKPSISLDLTAAPLFNGSLVVAKRILDFAVILTFGLACPLLGIAIAVSIYVNSLSWRLMIEHSCEGMLRGAVGGMWIAVCTVSMFWSVLFYDMVADQYGHSAGIAFSISTLFCFPAFLYLVFKVRSWLLAAARKSAHAKSGAHGGRNTNDSTGNSISTRSQFANAELWNEDVANTPKVPIVENNSEF